MFGVNIGEELILNLFWFRLWLWLVLLLEDSGRWFWELHTFLFAHLYILKLIIILLYYYLNYTLSRVKLKNSHNICHLSQYIIKF